VRILSSSAPAFSGLTAAITIGEGVDKLIAAGETIARPEMTLLDAADWIGGRARATDELSTGVSVDAGAHWFHGGARNPFLQMGLRSALRSGADRHRYCHAALSMSRWKVQWRLSSANGR